MNGRIYDPLLGRFLSADLVVQFPGSLQSYNRYAYVENNPLRYTDTTGFWIDVKVEEEKKKQTKAPAPQTGTAPHVEKLEKQKVTITYTAAIVNTSSQKLSAKEMKQLARRIEKSSEKAFKGKDKDGNKWKLDVKIRVIDKESDKSASEHIIKVMDIPENQTPGNPLTAGRGEFQGSEVQMEVRTRVLTPSKHMPGDNTTFERTGAHEIGHNMGLRHPGTPGAVSTQSDKNIMRQSRDSDGMKSEFPQIRSIIDDFNSGNLNKGLVHP